MRKMLKNIQVKVSKSQKGFTLIEMLVVVGIIVALAAVIVPTVIKFSGSGEEGAKKSEFDNVQAAIDLMITDNNLTSVTAGDAAAAITNTTDFGSGQLIAEYFRDDSTSYCYTWATTGTLLAQTDC